MDTNTTWVCWSDEGTAVRVTRTDDLRVEVEVYDVDEATGMFATLSVVQAIALSRALMERAMEAVSIANEEPSNE